VAKTNISTTARQVELFIRQLDSLSTLPEVATAFLTTVAGKKLDRSAIIGIIEADAALTARVFALAYDESVSFTNDKPSVKEAVAKLPVDLVRELILSLRIFHPSNCPSTEADNSLPIKELALHSIAVACAAKDIARIALDPQDRSIAFSAALLHDIGKLAIAELMPKSFEKIAADALELNLSYQAAEQKNLGIDHTIIGKRLAEKWHLPKDLVMAIWLHHSDTEAISGNLTAGKIAQVVALADTIANESGIGFSGNCDNQPATPEILQSLNITSKQVEMIKHNLAKEVQIKSNILGMTNPGGQTAYSQLLRETAQKLAADYKTLATGNRALATATAHMELICEFLLDVKPEMDALEISEIFAAAWKKHYQTGPVCIYTLNDDDQSTLEMVTLDDLNETKTILVNVPAGSEAIPAAIQKKFAVLKASETSKWIFDQLDFEMCKSSTVIVPLLVRQRAVGAIVFEHRSPADPADQIESLCTAATIAAGVIAMTGISDDHSRLAEKFADLLGLLKTTREKLAEAHTLAGVAEMAAGASHELNNPLAVISGRTQLLIDIETDENKKQMLKQIHGRADEVSQIVEELMAFARPTAPNPVTISVEEIIGSAVRQTEEEYNLRKLKLTLESPADSPNINADVAQMATAIKNIISNSLDSYPAGNGPITITIDTPKEEGFVTVRIIDTGCGMNTQTLAKATQPFFSAKPAGRKRGMGLAHARRLLDLNNAELHLQSKPEQGTTVTIKIKL
jgi:putative nucleotidyltransferase with HDIG domain